MSRLAFLTNTVLLACLGGVAGQQPINPESGDKTTPLLLKLVRERLAANPETAPAKGVRIDSVRFARGVLRLNGVMSSTAQRGKILEVLGQNRVAIEDEADVKIQRIDADGLVVAAQPPKRMPGGQDGRGPSGAGTPDAATGSSSPDAAYSGVVWDYGDPAFSDYSSEQIDGGMFYKHRFRVFGARGNYGYSDPDANAFSLQPSGCSRCWRR
jgi:hypothetical protein